LGIRHNRLLLNKVSLLLVVLLVGGLTFLGCARTGTIPKGWAGVEAAHGTLFLGSMEGKLVAIDISTHNRKWSFELPASKSTATFGCTPAATSVAIYGTPAASADLVYVSGYNGKIYALNPDSGALRWIYPREGYLQPIVGGIAIGQNKVYFASSDGKVYALDAATGDHEWEFQTGGKIWSTPVIDGNTLYVGSFDKKLYALSAADGSKKWEFTTEGGIASNPVIADDTVYVGSFDRHLYALNAADGSMKWQSKFEAGNWFWAKPVAYNNTIYAASLDHKLYILDAKTGGKIKEFDMGSPISSSPVLVESSVIVASQEGKVYAVDTGSNQIKQLVDLKEKVYAPLSTSDGVVYIHTQKHETLYALNPQTGAIIWNLTLSNK